MIKKSSNFLLALMFGVLLFGSSLEAREIGKTQDDIGLHKNAAGVAQTMSNIGNWGFWVNQHGQTGHDPFTGSSGGFYPRGVATAIYMDGFIWGGWKGGIDRANPAGKLMVGGIGYRIGTIAGWIQDDGTAVDPTNERVGIYRIRNDWRTLTISAVRADAAELFNTSSAAVTDADIQSVIDQYADDWKNWPVDLGAPYYDVDGDGTYNPVLDADGFPVAGTLTFDDGTELVGNDYPGLAQADQTVWLVVNDLNESRTQNHSGSDPMGLELQITLWAYNQPNATLGQIVFKKYKLINKSPDTIDSMFVAQYSDPDVGDYGDDVVGCDVDASLHFAYNGGPLDGQYAPFNMAPPAAGFDFFQGPIVDGEPDDTAIFDLKKIAGKKNLPMTSFGYFAAGADISDPPMGVYDFTTQWYNMLNGYIPTNDLENPSSYVEGSGPNAGSASKFPLWGDPETDQAGANSDIDAQGDNLAAGDRRMFAASGPFTMQPGDEQEVVVALLGGLGASNYNSVTDLKATDKVAQDVFDVLFTVVPKPPATPNVQIAAFDAAISLNWGHNQASVSATEDVKIINYGFEGYNVYQLKTASSKITDASTQRIATFDLINDVRIIKSAMFVPEFGTIVDMPVQFGTDNGIKRSLAVQKDYLTGGPLLKGTTYYFAVTAYNYDAALVRDRALETSAIILSATVQDPNPGVRYEGSAGELLDITKAAGVSDGAVEIEVVDPSATNGHVYNVVFVEDDDPDSPTFGDIVWELMDVTAGTTVLSKQVQQADLTSGDYPIVDGMVVKVSGPVAGINLTVDGPYGYYPGHQGYGVTGGTRWVSWPTNWGLETMGGALGNGSSFFGSDVIATDYVDVEIRFAAAADRTSETSEALMAASKLEFPDRWQKAVVYRRDLGYATQTTLADVPMQVWDTENNRQLKVGIVEDDNAGSGNFIWDMGWDGAAFPEHGGREYFFILNDTYDETYTEYLNNNLDGTYNGCLYAAGWGSRGYPYLHSAFEIQIFASNVNTVDDVFEFNAPAVTDDAELAKEDVKNINVFPNPYYASNPLEADRFNRFVTFTHLPQNATVRIFNLAGLQVRKIEKTDEGQFLRWDLNNESTLPVASGLYVVYIDMPDLNKTKTLKVMVIQSEQILEYY